MTSQTDASGNVTRFEYNSQNQLIKVTDSQGNSTSYTYDANGNRTSQTDANGKTTYYEYNYKGQLTKVTDSLGNVTTYTYGGTGCASCGGGGDKLTAITDAKGNTTSYQYDLSGRLIKETDPLGNVITYSYDSKGNLISKTDSNAINYNYDSLGRLIKKTYPDGSVEVFEYNSKSEITYAGNKDIAYQLSYDSNGRLTTSTDSNSLTVRYEYDSLGNRIKMIMPDGRIISYRYDANNRLIEIYSEGQIFTFIYDNLGRRTKMTLPNANGTYTTYSYDSNSRLTELVHKDSKGSVINSFAYTYDKVGNRLIKTEVDKKTAYSYDSIYRLIQALPTKLQGKDKTQKNKQELFTYDPIGNRQTGPETNDYYYYNQGSQLLSDRKHQYEYDNNGNFTKKIEIGDDNRTRIWIYSYDFENRLIQVVKQEDNETKIVTFKYDPFGRRIEKKVEEAGESKTYNFIYDNEDIILEYLSKTEDDDEGKTRITRYIHGLGIDEPLAVEQKGNTYYYHADDLGSIVALTDNKGKVVQSYTYDPFGGIKKQGGKVKDFYAFSGRIWDEDIRLYEYRNRFYDPEIGRFTTYDPSLYLRGGAEIPYLLPSLFTTPQELNPYVYTRNNPQTFVDSYGLLDNKFSFTMKVGGSVGYVIFGGGVFDATISEVNTGKTCRYTIKCFGIGVGLPQINITSKPATFSTNKCKECSEFEGYGYIGGASASVGAGITIGGGIKIPNGPFIPGDLLGWNYGGINIDVSHNLCHFNCYSR